MHNMISMNRMKEKEDFYSKNDEICGPTSKIA